MFNVYIKIKKFNEETGQIFFSCASDFTLHKDPNFYSEIFLNAYDIGINDKQQFLKYLSQFAKNFCEQKVKEENTDFKKEYIQDLKSLEGNFLTFDMENTDNYFDTVQEV